MPRCGTTPRLKILTGSRWGASTSRISISGEAATEPSEKTVDLLSLIDPARDAVAGVWKMSAGVLASDDTQHARIAFPYEPPEEYDFRLEFARAQDKGNMAALLVEHGTPFGWAMGVQSNRVCRFESVNRHVHEGNPTEVKFPLQRDRKYILVIKVRKDGVQAIVDGKVIDEYKTDYKDMSRYALWKLPNERTLAIGTSEGEFLIYSAEVVEINGEGKGKRGKRQGHLYPTSTMRRPFCDTTSFDEPVYYHHNCRGNYFGAFMFCFEPDMETSGSGRCLRSNRIIARQAQNRIPSLGR